jgi:hypothetical protein
VLVIALTTPGFSGLMFLPVEDNIEIFESGYGLRDRYLEQVAHMVTFLAEARDPEVIQFRDIFEKYGKGIPQKHFVREGVSCKLTLGPWL